MRRHLIVDLPYWPIGAEQRIHLPSQGMSDMGGERVFLFALLIVYFMNSVIADALTDLEEWKNLTTGKRAPCRSMDASRRISSSMPAGRTTLCG